MIATKLSTTQLHGVQSPKEFDGIAARLRAEQDAHGGIDSPVDYGFDVPVELAMSLTGYRHDHYRFEWSEPRFTVIECAGRPRFKLSGITAMLM